MYSIEHLLDDPKDIRMQHIKLHVEDFDDMMLFLNEASSIEKAKEWLHNEALHYGFVRILVDDPWLIH